MNNQWDSAWEVRTSSAKGMHRVINEARFELRNGGPWDGGDQTDEWLLMRDLMNFSTYWDLKKGSCENE